MDYLIRRIFFISLRTSRLFLEETKTKKEKKNKKGGRKRKDQQLAELRNTTKSRVEYAKEKTEQKEVETGVFLLFYPISSTSLRPKVTLPRWCVTTFAFLTKATRTERIIKEVTLTLILLDFSRNLYSVQGTPSMTENKISLSRYFVFLI